MKGSKNKSIKIVWILLSLFIITIVLFGSCGLCGFITFLIVDDDQEEEGGMTAKEAYNILIQIEKYKPFKNNISDIFQGSGRENGKSDHWAFNIVDGKNDEYLQYHVRVFEDGSYTHSERKIGSSLLISDWYMDSDEIMDIVKNLKSVKDFKKEFKWRIFESYSFHGIHYDYYPLAYPYSCTIYVGYSGGGGIWGVDKEIRIIINGSNGDIIEETKYVAGVEVEI